MELFLVICCGYEGIENIVGVFDKDTAMKILKEKKDSEKYKDDKNKWCVQKTILNGGKPECCCNELGIPPTETWLY